MYESDAKTHRTPKALRAKFTGGGRPVLVRQPDFWSAQASSRRFWLRVGLVATRDANSIKVGAWQIIP
jgi:hypothetical protein